MGPDFTKRRGFWSKYTITLSATPTATHSNRLIVQEQIPEPSHATFNRFDTINTQSSLPHYRTRHHTRPSFILLYLNELHNPRLTLYESPGW